MIINNCPMFFDSKQIRAKSASPISFGVGLGWYYDMSCLCAENAAGDVFLHNKNAPKVSHKRAVFQNSDLKFRALEGGTQD